MTSKSESQSEGENKSKRRTWVPLSFLLLAAFALGYWASHARASGIPATGALNYSGVLTNSDGTFVTGSQNILIQLYTQATGGSAACASQPATVTPVAGAFQVPLGDACTTLVHANSDVWADVLVNGASIGRSKLGAVPYAVEADHAASASTLSPGVTIAGGLMVSVVNGSALAAPCVPATGATTTIDCTCPAGTFAVAGGGYTPPASGQFLRESRPISATAWRVTCASPSGDVLCVQYNVSCSHLGP